MTAELQKLTPLQKELLATYSTDIKDEELEDIKRLLASYFAKKAILGADKIWSEKNYSDETMQEWLDKK